MNINKEGIQKKEFHVVFKGYKPEEVDKFLDILTVEFDRLQKSQRQLQENLERLKYDGNKESVEMKRVIQEALVSAHKVAEDIKRKAEKEAEEIVRNKIAKEEEAYKYLLGKKAQLEGDIKKLNQEYEDFKGKIYKVVDDFKETTSKLADEKFIKIPEIGEKVLDIDKIKIGE
ncbi:MAG: DivIVA domain-containing protein, partial [Actinobacteria bacterium]